MFENVTISKQHINIWKRIYTKYSHGTIAQHLLRSACECLDLQENVEDVCVCVYRKSTHVHLYETQTFDNDMKSYIIHEVS